MIGCSAPAPAPEPVPDSVPAGVEVQETAPGDVDEALAQLARRVDGIESLSATYTVGDDEHQGTIRFHYAAPDRALLDTDLGEVRICMWVLGGRVVFEGRAPDGPFRGEFQADALVPENDLFEVLERELPDPDDAPRQDIGPGPILSCTIAADPKKPDGLNIQIQLSWVQHRQHLFGWLCDPGKWDRTEEDGRRLVRDLTNGGTVSLSMETGFLEAKGPGSRRVQLTECGPLRDDSVFEINTPIEGAKDLSEEYAAQAPRAVWHDLRPRMLNWIVRAADSGRIEPAELDERVARVLESYHRTRVHLDLDAWLASSRASIDDFVNWCARTNPYVERGSDQDEELEATIASWREKLVRGIATRGKRQLAQVRWIEGVQDFDQMAHLLELEREAVRRVYQEEVATPMCARFDDGIARARSPK